MSRKPSFANLRTHALASAMESAEAGEGTARPASGEAPPGADGGGVQRRAEKARREPGGGVTGGIVYHKGMKGHR